MQDIISTASLAIVAITLVAYVIQARELLKQTKLLAATNKALLAENVNLAMTEISKVLIQYPEIRPCIYSSSPVPEDEPARSRVLAAAEMVVDLMWHTIHSEVFFESDDKDAWHRYFADLASSSPAIQEYWVNRREWYDAPIWDVVDGPVTAALAKREMAGPSFSSI